MYQKQQYAGLSMRKDLRIKIPRNFPPLSKEEERELFIKYKTMGDIKARDKIILSNVGFIIKEANKFSRTVDIQDLVQEAFLLLSRYIDKFDPELETKYYSYLKRGIKGKIKEFLYETSKTVRYRKNLWVKKGSPMTLSLNIPVYKESGRPLDKIDRLESKEKDIESTVLHSLEIERVIKSLYVLSDKEKKIVKAYYGIYHHDSWKYNKPLSLSDISKEIGMTREGIRQILIRATKKLSIVCKRDTTKFIPLSLMICSRCGSKHVVSSGRETRNSYHIYKCKNCGKQTISRTKKKTQRQHWIDNKLCSKCGSNNIYKRKSLSIHGSVRWKCKDCKKETQGVDYG